MSEAALGQSIILFGAFDRHNLGDLLFPHIAAALLPGRTLVYAGLAATPP
ncbi:MAG: polysaccharide pyruvyl transferase family protein, partial [Rubrivivax sp.]|nr:polysaccharide pyruvyl transferase family protein [Rubrivivax sp.]